MLRFFSPLLFSVAFVFAILLIIGSVNVGSILLHYVVLYSAAAAVAIIKIVTIINNNKICAYYYHHGLVMTVLACSSLRALSGIRSF